MDSNTVETSSKSTVPKAKTPVLKIVTKTDSKPEPQSVDTKSETKEVQSEKVQSEKVQTEDTDSGDSDSSSGSDGSDGSETTDGFYVELSLCCTNDEGDQEYHKVMFNFETEENYVEHGDTGFEDLDTYFMDGVNCNFPGWEYADEWEEYMVHGQDLPDDHDGVVIDIN